MKRLLTLIFAFVSLFLHAQDFTVTNFDINLTINADGSYDVIEIVDVNFSKKKRGIIRDIKNLFASNGKKYSLDIVNVQVQNHKYKVTNRKENVKIRIGDPDVYITGNQQYTISYKIK
ncbi:MAG: DUF2207 domain-containing protein, partial [Bacteroidota bacterium]